MLFLSTSEVVPYGLGDFSWWRTSFFFFFWNMLKLSHYNCGELCSLAQTHPHNARYWAFSCVCVCVCSAATLALNCRSSKRFFFSCCVVVWVCVRGSRSSFGWHSIPAETHIHMLEELPHVLFSSFACELLSQGSRDGRLAPTIHIKQRFYSYGTKESARETQGIVLQ